MVGFFIIFSLVIYFVPTISAAVREKNNAVGIFLLNLFLGWTLVGWVVALVWASTNDAPKARPADDGDTRTCPYCAETIKAAAAICKHCGRELREQRVVNGVVMDEGFTKKAG